MGMPIGMILLLIVGVLVYFGIAQRLLDRMRLTDKQAMLFIGGIVIGSFIDIPLVGGANPITINVGGAILPALLAIYLIIKADEPSEKVRGVVAAVLVAGVVWLGSRYLPAEPEEMFMDPKLIYGIAAGIIAYIAGRSRRSAFIGGVLGIIISDIVHTVTLVQRGIPGPTRIGGAGAFDVVIIAGLVGIMLAELIGETREKLQGGAELGPNRPEGLYEFSKELTQDDTAPQHVVSQTDSEKKEDRGEKDER